MNEALLQTLMRLVIGRELPKLCTNCGAPAANYSLGWWGGESGILYVGCDSCSETVAEFHIEDLLATLNRTL